MSTEARPYPNPKIKCEAPHDDRQETYNVEFRTFLEHARKHLPKAKERWEQLIPGWISGETVSFEDALKYLELTYRTVSECFGLPRYVHGYDFESRRLADDVREQATVSPAAREWKAPSIALYFACYESAILVCGVLRDSYVYIRTSHRIGSKNDTKNERVLKIKRRVLRMTSAQHEEHLLVPLRWYSGKSWAFGENE